MTAGGILSRLFAFVSRREAKIASLVFILLAVGFVAWLGFQVADVRSNLEEARASAQQAKDALLRGETAEAGEWADTSRSQAQAARDASHSVPWSVAAAVPWLGSPFVTMREITDVVLGVVVDVLQPAANTGSALSSDALFHDGRVDVHLLRDQEPVLSTLADNADRLASSAEAVAEPAFPDSLSDARSALATQTSDLATMLDNTALAARLAPSMMGADGPRTYFMGFQTNAEARGTGGLLGGFGVLRFDDGVATIDTLGPNTELVGPFRPIDLGDEYAEQYGYTNPTVDYRNSNMSAHFPHTAQIWRSMWAQQTGVNVDGVIAIDPVALSYILGPVGPVRLSDGEAITSENVVELTESTAYQRFPTDQQARKQYLQDIANAVVEKMLGPVESPAALMEAIGRAVGERRIAVWSSSPEEQGLLEQTPLAHVIPDDPAPYAGVVINNLGGNKMDYYLTREIEYASDSCAADTRLSTVTVRLTNTLAPGTELPEYVAGSAGVRSDLPISMPSGTMVTSVRLLATTGASLLGVLSNGERVPAFVGAERGHPTFEVQVAIPPGQSGELSFRLSEPTVPGAARVPVQPLVDAVAPVVTVPECVEGQS